MNYIKKLLCVGLVGTTGFSVLADVVYDNFANYNGHVFTVNNGQQIGNEITLPGSTGLMLTNFAIEYYTPDATLAQGPTGVGIDVRFYYNDGPATNGFATPGTMFYDSGWFYNLMGNTGAGGNNGYNVVTYSSFTGDFPVGGLPLNLPGNNLTFTITFTGLNAFNQVFLPLATNTPGISYGDYWMQNGSGAWTLMSTNAADANLVVDFSATPEPSTVALVTLGGMALVGFNKLRRKR